MNERLKRQLDFIIELDKSKNIIRQNYLCDGSRRENDSEHSWHIAIMIFILKEYAPADVNIERVMEMALLHDVVEIDAGDTYAYDEKAALDKEEREKKAAERIFNMLPADQAAYVRALWDEFEALETSEALWCKVMDCLQPLLLNYTSGGKSWGEHQVHEEQVRKRMEPIKKCSAKLYEIVEDIVKKAIDMGKIIPCKNSGK